MHVISVGELFPGPVPAHQGSVAEFLKNDGNTLFIFEPSIDQHDVEVYDKGELYVGMLNEEDYIRLIWKQYKPNGTTFSTWETPFDCRMYGANFTPTELTEDGERIAFMTVLVETNSRKVKAIRYSTLDPVFSRRFVEAAKRQYSYKEGYRHVNYNQLWDTAPLKLLAEAIEFYKVGAE